MEPVTAAEAGICNLCSAGSEIVGGGANAVATAPAGHRRARHGGGGELVSTERAPGPGAAIRQTVDPARRSTANHAEA